MSPDPEARAAGLPCWSGAVRPEPLGGGISNHNFVVADRGRRFVVRIGDDLPVHGVLRSFELAASRAAHAAGLSPEVVYAEPGAIVFGHIDGETLTPEAVRAAPMLTRIVALVQRGHREIPRHVRGKPALFWVFHAIRDYAAQLRADHARLVAELPSYLAAAERLERAVGPVELVFAHNDLLAANLIDDGRRLWLVDWEYGGFNSPLFDLANLASNNELDPDQERGLLEAYFAAPLTAEHRRRYEAMRCASLLREALWSMVSEIHLALDFDYVGYTDTYLERFKQAYRAVEVD